MEQGAMIKLDNGIVAVMIEYLGYDETTDMHTGKFEAWDDNQTQFVKSFKDSEVIK